MNPPMTPRLAGYMTMTVPRYTSYPTVPHFSARIGATEQARWLGALDPAQPVSLYIHVPFCRRLCWYCGCNMKLAARYDPVAAYVGTLIREVALVARHLPARLTVSHLAWGGGTPTALEPGDLDRVMAAVRRHFDLSPAAELAIEADPRTLTDAMVTRIGALGFTRASFGVQEFDPAVQRAINRVQPPGMVRDATDSLRAAGVRGINYDLIYGLPHQTVTTLARTIDLVAAMRPDRVALFGYAHVPWMALKQRMIDEAALPGAAARAEQAASAAEALKHAGYVTVGLDHFALPGDPLAVAARQGTLRRNFQGYTTDVATTLIGLGATAIGRTPVGHVQNIAETGAWTRAVRAGALPVARGHALSDADRLRGHVIEELMCSGQTDLAEAGCRLGAAPDWYSDEAAALRAMAADGLVEFDGKRLRVMPDARPLVRTVAAVFDTYLASRAARHSVAV